ncbi:ATP-binding cassette domain-containing protein [Modestobacter sp. I12A-02628]|uniref:ATP-binding cassette domain-containing protein n=1 Tax=Goekera deserti TaxID=2497753 RepID=A0A7K3WBG8_9ACTN|nr:ATP-binding cassette domain-containing protein [Goekera deserti]MPQ97433.1 ATP-binding cassette domain-containing protein [Goekera deserti]NDI47966.1 ATP-binding cassette domain-containing protein [Goekera deserti]NEL53714.1 ATP-binding cassette domain-containing protein [Goekera deserti]
MSALDARGITVRYGGVVAVDDVDIVVREGEVLGVIGPNGAGKSSLVDAITGLTRCTGTVELDGVDVTRARVHQRALAGLSRTWQTVELFADLTVEENLRIVRTRHVEHDVDGEIERALELLGIADTRHLLPAELSLGGRKLVGVARALVAGPRVICMDEPAAGLDSRESAALGRSLRSIADGGTGILLIDHDMDMVLGTCDELHVLDFGRTVATGAPQDVRRDPAVLRAYLGETHEPEAVAHHG